MTYYQWLSTYLARYLWHQVTTWNTKRPPFWISCSLGDSELNSLKLSDVYTWLIFGIIWFSSSVQKLVETNWPAYSVSFSQIKYSIRLKNVQFISNALINNTLFFIQIIVRYRIGDCHYLKTEWPNLLAHINVSFSLEIVINGIPIVNPYTVLTSLLILLI